MEYEKRSQRDYVGMTHKFSEQRDPRFEDSAQLKFLGCSEY